MSVAIKTSNGIETVANVGGGSSGEIFSTTEQKIGTWIDGGGYYRKVVTGLSATMTNNNWSEICDLPTGCKQIYKVHLYFTSGSANILVQPNETRMASGKLSCNAFVGNTRTIHTAIMEYTKTS